MIYKYEDILRMNIPGYVNGQYKKNLKLVLAYLDPDNSDSYDNWLMEKYMEEISDHKEKCCCSHEVKYEFRAVHKTTDDRIILGSSCINLFDDKYKKQTQRAIDLFHSPENKYCPTCDTKVAQTVVKQYPNEEKIYHKKCWNELQKERKKKEKLAKREYKTAMNRFINFGKYKDLRLGEILIKDKSYIEWLAENSYNEMIKYYAKLIFHNNEL